MQAPIIADLAAWTYEHDRKCFYEKLVSPDAKLSGFGVLQLSMWKPINEGGLIYKHRFYSEIGKALAHADLECVEVPVEWRHWGQSDYESPIPSDLNTALIVSAIMDSGFLSEERQSQLDWASFFHGEKKEYYATFLMTILRRLNEGKTKDEAISDIPNPVINYYPNGREHKWNELLEYTTFAWRCFYYSWDFTSAIHNAAKCNGNRRLAMVLTGAFAGAMYGCTYNLIKQKFKAQDKLWPEMIGMPQKVIKSYGDVIQEMSKDAYSNRFFFKKNDSLTNVERHKWTQVKNPYSNIFVDEALKSKIMRAYHTGWEQRYGVYLDNGWFYVYRSYRILLRFQIQDHHIVNLQISDDPASHVEDLSCVLAVLSRP